MTDYLTVDQLRDWIGSDTTNFQAAAQAACTVASRAVETMCDRVFTTTTEARYYRPENSWEVCVDDISTTTALAVITDDGYNGFTSGTTTWTITTDFVLEPRNPNASGVARPWTEICGTGTRYFPPPQLGHEQTVKVTATWGWPSVPDAVTHATRVYAAWLFKQKDAPDGFIGLDGWGPRFLRENPTVAAVLGPYMRNPIAVA